MTKDKILNTFDYFVTLNCTYKIHAIELEDSTILTIIDEYNNKFEFMLNRNIKKSEILIIKTNIFEILEKHKNDKCLNIYVKF